MLRHVHSQLEKSLVYSCYADHRSSRGPARLEELSLLNERVVNLFTREPQHILRERPAGPAFGPDAR
jgi:hypothetical protein